MNKVLVRASLGFALGFMASALLISVFHARHWIAPVVPGNALPYTYAIQRCFGVRFVAGALALAFALGFLVRHAPAIAAGMILPLPITAGIEMYLDRTSHDVLHYEIIFTWVPALLALMIAAWIGGRLRGALSGGRKPRAPQPT